MTRKAIILDLDNTIYPVPSIGNKLFKSLFELIERSGEFTGDIIEIKAEIMRTPFQKVAKNFSFSKELFENCMKLLPELSYDEPMDYFNDYEEVRRWNIDKFLVTVGFYKMQQSKIKQLGIEKDFKEIFIVDPVNSDKTKKDIFLEIIAKNGYSPSDLIVVGDDLKSEINAAIECGIDAVWYNRSGAQASEGKYFVIQSLKELEDFLR